MMALSGGPLCQNSCHLWRPQPDGSIIFSAETAGIHDNRIWILNWGANARVLAPESLK